MTRLPYEKLLEMEAAQKRINNALNTPALRPLKDLQLQERRIAAMVDPLGTRFDKRSSTTARTTRVEKVAVESPEPCEAREQKPAKQPAKGFKSERWSGSRGSCELWEMVHTFIYTAYKKDRTQLKVGITSRTYKETCKRYERQGFVIAAFEPRLDNLTAERAVKRFLEQQKVPSIKGKSNRRTEYHAYNEALIALRLYGAWPLGSLESAPMVEGEVYQTDLWSSFT